MDEPRQLRWNRERARHLLIHGARRLPMLAASLALAALIVRLTLRDRVPILSALYYATPPHLIALLFTLAAIGWAQRRRFGRATAALGAGLPLLGWWLYSAWFFAPLPAQGGEARAMLWNIGRGKMGYSRIVEKIKAQRADLVILNEAGRDPKWTKRFFRERFPEYQVSDAPGQLLVMVRGEFEEMGKVVTVPGARYRIHRVRTGNLRLSLVHVDMVSNLLASRKEGFRRLLEACRPLLGGPLLIAGDFNTPTDSIYLAPWRENLLNGFECAGRGCSATWPTGLPLQAIDQVWLSRALTASRYQLHSTLLSDHRMVTFELSRAASGEESTSGSIHEHN